MTDWDKIYQPPSVVSPCTGLCRCNEDDVCMGCGRTREDIARWMVMSDDEKRECKRLCKVRLEQLNHEQD